MLIQRCMVHSGWFFFAAGRKVTHLTVWQGSRKSNFVFHVTYKGKEVIEDGRVILFFAPESEPEPRFKAFDLEAPRPIFAKDVVSKWVL